MPLAYEVSDLFPSKAYFICELPIPGETEGRFIYRYFEPTEKWDESAAYLGNQSEREINLIGGARSIRFTIQPPKAHHFDGQIDFTEFTNWMDNVLEQKIVIGSNILSEYDIQKNGYIRLDFDPSDQELQILHQSNSYAAEKIDIFQAQISNVISSETTDSLAETIVEAASTSPDMVPLVEPSTGQPIKSSINEVPDLSMTNTLATDFCSSIVRASISNGSSPYHDQLKKIQEDFENTQIESRATHAPGTIDADEFELLSKWTDPQNINNWSSLYVPKGALNTYTLQPDVWPETHDTGTYFLGYLILKYEKLNETDLRFVSAYITPSGLTDISTIEDNKILYGTEYQFFIHSAALVIYSLVPAMSAGDLGLTYGYNEVKGASILYSEKYQRITLPTTELVVPQPPSNLKAKLNKNFISLTWKYNFGEVTGPAGNALIQDDLGGVQIFVRESLDDPYTLVKHLKFIPEADLPPENIAIEYISEYDKKQYQYDLIIRPNRLYYFALIAIDAHGNSSNYSEQIEVMFDNVKGRLVNRQVSPQGAPKQYPNLYMINNLYKDSMTSSTFENIDIYYHPDSPSVEKVGLTEDYVVQLIDVAAQDSVKISINILSEQEVQSKIL